jgi:MFS family permease
MDATSIGLLYAAGNVGFIIGAIAVGAVTARFGVGPTLVVAAVGGAVATVILPFASGAVAVGLLFAGRFIGALTIPLFNVNARALRQSRAPWAALGRVNAFFRLIDWGTLPIGALLGGWLGSNYGLRSTLVMAAVLGVASAAWLIPSPLWRVRRLEEGTEGQTEDGNPRSASGAARGRVGQWVRRPFASAGRAIARPSSALGRLPSIRWAWLAIGGAALQVALSLPAVNTQVGGAPPFLYVLSSTAVVACLVVNLRIPGLAIAAAGGACNLAAIIANGGYMPVSPEGARMVGHLPPIGYSHTIEAASAYLQPLTDIIVVPPPLPFSNVYSIGDLLLIIGLTVTFASAAHGWSPSQRAKPVRLAQPAANESTGQA